MPTLLQCLLRRPDHHFRPLSSDVLAGHRRTLFSGRQSRICNGAAMQGRVHFPTDFSGKGHRTWSQKDSKGGGNWTNLKGSWLVYSTLTHQKIVLATELLPASSSSGDLFFHHTHRLHCYLLPDFSQFRQNMKLNQGSGFNSLYCISQ